MRNDVFVCYSHKDTKYLDRLRRHFKPISKIASFWDDSRILAGQRWKNEIENALNNAKVAILLISTDFFNSQFIENVELPTLLERARQNGTLILSVILKPCMYGEYPEISQFQSVNSPDNTLIEMSEADQELLFVSLMQQIKNYFQNDN